MNHPTQERIKDRKRSYEHVLMHLKDFCDKFDCLCFEKDSVTLLRLYEWDLSPEHRMEERVGNLMWIAWLVLLHDSKYVHDRKYVFALEKSAFYARRTANCSCEITGCNATRATRENKTLFYFFIFLFLSPCCAPNPPVSQRFAHFFLKY